jgi:ribosome-binding factor A
MIRKPDFKAQRQKRMAVEIHQQVAMILPEVLRWEVLPGVKGPVTIMQVTMTKDLRKVDVFLSLNAQEHQEALKHIRTLIPAVRKQLAHRLNSRFTPEVGFHYANLSYEKPVQEEGEIFFPGVEGFELET